MPELQRVKALRVGAGHFLHFQHRFLRDAEERTLPEKYIVRECMREFARDLIVRVNSVQLVGHLIGKLAKRIQKIAAISANGRERLQRDEHRGEGARHYRAFFIGGKQLDAARRNFFDGSAGAASNCQSSQFELRLQIFGGLQGLPKYSRSE